MFYSGSGLWWLAFSSLSARSITQTFSTTLGCVKPLCLKECKDSHKFPLTYSNPVCLKAAGTWLSILISVSVSLSRNASTKACTPAPVMKLDSKFKLRNVLFSRSISLNAWDKEGEIKQRRKYGVVRHQQGHLKPTKPLLLTTAIGSLLRVAARLNFLTCVFFSMALAKSFRVGMGMFWKTKKTCCHWSRHGRAYIIAHSENVCFCVP